MGRTSNNCIGLINLLSFIISIPILALAIVLTSHRSALGGRAEDECIITFEKPFLAFSIFIFIISFLGLVGSCCKVISLLRIYMALMLILMIGLFCFTIFGFVVTRSKVPHEGLVIPDFGNEKQMNDYSPWMRNLVLDSHNWDKVKSCAVGSDLCHGLLNHTLTENFLQTACCMPPIECGFKYVNATIWQVPKSAAGLTGDCATWNNNQQTLCFNCRTCKGAILEGLNQEGKHLALTNIPIIVFIMIIYCIAICAFKNTQEKYKGYAYP